MTIERIKFFLISDVNCGVDQFGEENVKPGASQMKPARKSEAALCVLRKFFRRLKTCFNSAKRCYRATEKRKGVRGVARTPFQIGLGVLGTPGHIKTRRYGC